MPVTGRSRTVAVVGLVVLLVLAFCGLTLRLFVFPDLNAPVRSDAIAVLGGNGAGPLAQGEELARQGYAPTIVLSLNPYQMCANFVGIIPGVTF